VASYRRILVTEGSGGSDLSLRSDNLDSVSELYTEDSELYTEDDFRQLVVAIEATPTFFGSLGELEDHGERGFVWVVSRIFRSAPGDRQREVGASPIRRRSSDPCRPRAVRRSP
jgi:hypothetical protein